MRILHTYKKGAETLYNFSALTDLRNLAPAGFRVAKLEDVVNLLNYLGGEDLAGGKLKALTNWAAPNTGATDEAGFSAIPAGIRNDLGAFLNELLENRIWIDNR